MTAIVSATTSTIKTTSNKRAIMVGRAIHLQNSAVIALQNGQLADALEFAYQAALRTAGAYFAEPQKVRRKKSGSVWDRIAKMDDRGAFWAAKFKPYSRTRARALSGLPVDFVTTDVQELLSLVDEFLAEVEGAGNSAPIAA